MRKKPQRILRALLLGGFLLKYGGGIASAETLQYSYDAMHRLAQARAFQNGIVWEYRYDSANNRRVEQIAQAGACADNTVCNGDFAQQFTYWNGTDNATLVAGRTGQAAQVEKDSGNSDIQQLLPGVFEAGKTYRAVAWCKAAAGNACYFFLGDSNVAYGAAFEHEIRQEWGGNGDWQQISTPPLTLAHQERLNIYLYAGITDAAAYDDVRVEETTQYACPDRAVCNGAFERGFEYWTTTANAQLASGRTGNGIRTLKTPAGWSARQLLPGAFTAGMTYRATVWCKANAGTSCGLLFGDVNTLSGPAYEHTASQTVNGTGAWQQVAATVTLTHQERLNVMVFGGNDALYDDVQVQAVAPAVMLLSRSLSFVKSFGLHSPPSEKSSPSVPEPGMLLLFISGFVGIAALLRRRR